VAATGAEGASFSHGYSSSLAFPRKSYRQSAWPFESTDLGLLGRGTEIAGPELLYASLSFAVLAFRRDRWLGRGSGAAKGGVFLLTPKRGACMVCSERIERGPDSGQAIADGASYVANRRDDLRARRPRGGRSADPAGPLPQGRPYAKQTQSAPARRAGAAVGGRRYAKQTQSAIGQTRGKCFPGLGIRHNGRIGCAKKQSQSASVQRPGLRPGGPVADEDCSGGTDRGRHGCQSAQKASTGPPAGGSMAGPTDGGRRISLGTYL